MKENIESNNVSVRSFVTAILVVLILMIFTYGLTFMIPSGEYARVLDANGNSIIDISAGFHYVDVSFPFWKWLLSPILVLGAEGNGLLIAILIFLLVIGGIFNSLEVCGLMKYMLARIVNHFGHARYQLMATITFFFMAMGAFIGSFEECVPMVPIVAALAVNLGWDVMTGLGMSLLAAGCGFASGVCNPFTVGVAQSLAGLPMFSGIWLRAISFVLIYGLLLLFLIHHSKTFASANPGTATPHSDFKPEKKMDTALIYFGSILGFGIMLVLSSGFLTFLQDYTMIIVAVMFLIAGILASRRSGMSLRELGKSFLRGMVSIFPAVILILLASSIRFILSEGKILDTILHWAVQMVDDLPRTMVILFIYLLVLVMNFFISSGSAKAFLLIPLIVPMTQLFGIEPQLSVMAFAFGDGFSNVFYPTNAALLIALGLANVNYGDWVRFSWKFQALNLILTSLLLLFGLAVGYC